MCSMDWLFIKDKIYVLDIIIPTSKVRKEIGFRWTIPKYLKLIKDVSFLKKATFYFIEFKILISWLNNRKQLIKQMGFKFQKC